MLSRPTLRMCVEACLEESEDIPESRYQQNVKYTIPHAFVVTGFRQQSSKAAWVEGSVNLRFEREDYGRLNTCDSHKGPSPKGIRPVHLGGDCLTTASTVGSKAFTGVVSSGVRLVLVCRI